VTFFDAGSSLAERFRTHAAALESSHDPAPLYVRLMRAMADDWDDGGVVRDICRGWEDAPPGSVVQLRLLGGLHRLVLAGDAPDLARFYPTAGGTLGPAGVWRVAEPVLRQHAAELHEALDIAPQTNEPGRSTALLVGLLHAVRHLGLSNIRLLEVGASGGLNLLVDEFRFSGDGWACGPSRSPLQLVDAVRGAARLPLPPWSVVERRGCDLQPVDVVSDDGRLRLRSFVWPDHLERFHRLGAALEVASHVPVTVDRAAAAVWLQERLAEPVERDVLTVVWQSITRMYWPPSEVAAVERAVATAGAGTPVAHVAMEYAATGGHTELTVALWPGDGTAAGSRRLATVADHGVPVRLEPGTRLGD
jgi:hypothetical protein